MASRRQTGASADRPVARDALVAAAKRSLADHFPSAITGRSLAESAGVQYGQLHRHFGSKTAVFAAAFDELLDEYASAGTDEAGVPRPLALRDIPTFWRAVTHLLLDRATFESFRPSAGVLAQATVGVGDRRPDLVAEQAEAVVALGIAIEFGVLIHRAVLGRAVRLDTDEPAVEHLVRQWLEGLYVGSGPLGAVPAASAKATSSRVRSQAAAGGADDGPGDTDGHDPSAEDRLIEAGARLLEDRAPSAITGRQLAREAGANYGLIHHYFGTKDEVLRQSVQLHRDRFFAANSVERRAPGYFSVCEHQGYVRATTSAAIDSDLSVAEQRFPVMDTLLGRRLATKVGQSDELATRVAVFVAVSAQLAWALFSDVFERSFETELVRLEVLVAPLLHELLYAPTFETEFSC
jgi:AcrR family transcriptional regulator